MKRIDTRDELGELARELGVRADWHEPDEQEVTIEVYGTDDFDNAGFWPAGHGYGPGNRKTEAHVILCKEGEPVAAVNLATLFSWAAEAPVWGSLPS